MAVFPALQGGPHNHQMRGGMDGTPCHWAMDIGSLGLIENGIPSGNLTHSELERSTIVNGKTHYFYGHFQ